MGEKSCERTNWGTLLRDRGRITFVAVGKDGKARGIPREGNLELERALASIEELQLNC